MQQPTTLGSEFAVALAAKDFGRLLDLMHPCSASGLRNPTRSRRSSDSERDAIADCERVGYRFNVRNSDGRFLVEQQAYLSERDGRIGWMRVLCSGYRPSTDR
jgi:hypothetical protein